MEELKKFGKKFEKKAKPPLKSLEKDFKQNFNAYAQYFIQSNKIPPNNEVPQSNPLELYNSQNIYNEEEEKQDNYCNLPQSQIMDLEQSMEVLGLNECTVNSMIGKTTIKTNNNSSNNNINNTNNINTNNNNNPQTLRNNHINQQFQIPYQNHQKISQNNQQTEQDDNQAQAQSISEENDKIQIVSASINQEQQAQAHQKQNLINKQIWEQRKKNNWPLLTQLNTENFEEIKHHLNLFTTINQKSELRKYTFNSQNFYYLYQMNIGGESLVYCFFSKENRTKYVIKQFKNHNENSFNEEMVTIYQFKSDPLLSQHALCQDIQFDTSNLLIIQPLAVSSLKNYVERLLHYKRTEQNQEDFEMPKEFLLYLLQFFANSLNDMEKNNIFIGDIKPDNILVLNSSHKKEGQEELEQKLQFSDLTPYHNQLYTKGYIKEDPINNKYIKQYQNYKIENMLYAVFRTIRNSMGFKEVSDDYFLTYILTHFGEKLFMIFVKIGLMDCNTPYKTIKEFYLDIQSAIQDPNLIFERNWTFSSTEYFLEMIQKERNYFYIATNPEQLSILQLLKLSTQFLFLGDCKENAQWAIKAAYFRLHVILSERIYDPISETMNPFVDELQEYCEIYDFLFKNQEEIQKQITKQFNQTFALLFTHSIELFKSISIPCKKYYNAYTLLQNNNYNYNNNDCETEEYFRICNTLSQLIHYQKFENLSEMVKYCLISREAYLQYKEVRTFSPGKTTISQNLLAINKFLGGNIQQIQPEDYPCPEEKENVKVFQKKQKKNMGSKFLNSLKKLSNKLGGNRVELIDNVIDQDLSIKKIISKILEQKQHQLAENTIYSYYVNEIQEKVNKSRKESQQLIQNHLEQNYQKQMTQNLQYYQ